MDADRIAEEIQRVSTFTLDGLPWMSPAPTAGPRGFAPWIRSLDGESGVYLVRDRESGDLLYVGESHKGRLYSTLTRHLQEWHGFGSGHSWDPADVEIAVVLTSPGAASAVQFYMVQRFGPVLNEVRGDGGIDREDTIEGVPF